MRNSQKPFQENSTFVFRTGVLCCACLPTGRVTSTGGGDRAHGAELMTLLIALITQSPTLGGSVWGQNNTTLMQFDFTASRLLGNVP